MTYARSLIVYPFIAHIVRSREGGDKHKPTDDEKKLRGIFATIPNLVKIDRIDSLWVSRAAKAGALMLVLVASIAIAEPTVFVVRHAEKAEVGGKDPGLSEAGRRRAQALATMLKDAQISAIYATEFKRTQQTAAPLAKSLSVDVTVIPAADLATLEAKLRGTGNALVVGHSNTVPELLQRLGAEKPVTISDGEYDNLFVVTVSAKSNVLHLHYR